MELPKVIHDFEEVHETLHHHLEKGVRLRSKKYLGELITSNFKAPDIDEFLRGQIAGFIEKSDFSLKCALRKERFDQTRCKVLLNYRKQAMAVMWFEEQDSGALWNIESVQSDPRQSKEIAWQQFFAKFLSLLSLLPESQVDAIALDFNKIFNLEAASLNWDFEILRHCFRMRFSEELNKYIADVPRQRVKHVIML